MQALGIIARLLYQIMILQMYERLWSTYLKSGMGQLIVPVQRRPSYSTTVPIWPKAVEQLSGTEQLEACRKLVQQQLRLIDDRSKHGRTVLQEKIKALPGFTTTIQKKLETYLDKNLASCRRSIEHQSELVHFDYHIRATRLAFLQLKPTKEQVCFSHPVSFCRLLMDDRNISRNNG
jgi:hypothetical protein